MKKVHSISFLAVAFVFLQLSMTVPAFSTAIDLVSSDYHIWGVIAANVLYDSGAQNTLYKSYNAYSAQPISYRTTFAEEINTLYQGRISYDPWYAESKVDAFQMKVASKSSAIYSTPFNSFGVSMLSTGPGGDAFADATWIFKTSGSNVKFDLEYLIYQAPWSKGNIWITDLTAGTELYYEKFPITGEGSARETLELDLDPSHIYSMRVYGEAESAWDQQLFSFAASFNVPEPSTMLLLASGIFGLIGFRNKFRKN